MDQIGVESRFIFVLRQRGEDVRVDDVVARLLFLVHFGPQRDAAVEQLERLVAETGPAAQVAAMGDDVASMISSRRFASDMAAAHLRQVLRGRQTVTKATADT